MVYIISKLFQNQPLVGLKDNASWKFMVYLKDVRKNWKFIEGKWYGLLFVQKNSLKFYFILREVMASVFLSIYSSKAIDSLVCKRIKSHYT